MRGLIIEERWLKHILGRKKDWELRSRSTRIRGKIALIQKGSGLIVGTAFLLDSIPRSLPYLSRHKNRHQCDRNELIKYSHGKRELHTWVLKKVKRLKHPVPYTHPQGAVTWVTLPDGILERAS